MSAVGIQESTGKIHDLFPPPDKYQTGLFRYHRDLRRLQVLFPGIAKKCFHVFGINHNCHPLLRLRDSDLCSVQAGIFLRHLIQVYPKPVGQLSDSHRDAAGAKVITFLDETAYLFPAEQALDLPLGRRISLLYLRAAGLDGLLCMDLGGTGGSAAAVPPGPSAQQDNDISRIRSLPDHRTARRGAQDCSDLHSFRHIIRMIDLLHRSGGKADLVSVGTVSVSRLPYQLLLRQLSFHGLFHGDGGIRRTRHTHGLVHIGTAGQGIPDGSAKTGGRSSERLDLSGMVVGLVLKVHQPLFFHPVHFYGDHNTAGIDLLRLFLVLQLSFLFQSAHGHQRQIHQADKLVLSPPEDLAVVMEILPVGVFHGLAVIPFPKGNFRKLCGKSSVTAVIRPVGIQHPDLRHRGVSLFLPPEIILNMEKIFECHGKSKRIVELL